MILKVRIYQYLFFASLPTSSTYLNLIPPPLPPDTQVTHSTLVACILTLCIKN